MSWATLDKTSIRSATESPLIRGDEIYLASFPFGDTAGMKLRPVLTLTGQTGPVPEVLGAYISSVIPSLPLSTDLILDPASARDKATNLKAVSALRLHKLAPIHSTSFVRRLGKLSSATKAMVDDSLRTFLKL